MFLTSTKPRHDVKLPLDQIRGIDGTYKKRFYVYSEGGDCSNGGAGKHHYDVGSREWEQAIALAKSVAVILISNLPDHESFNLRAFVKWTDAKDSKTRSMTKQETDGFYMALLLVHTTFVGRKVDDLVLRTVGEVEFIIGFMEATKEGLSFVSCLNETRPFSEMHHISTLPYLPHSEGEPDEISVLVDD